jgi:hypothetical protein
MSKTKPLPPQLTPPVFEQPINTPPHQSDNVLYVSWSRTERANIPTAPVLDKKGQVLKNTIEDRSESEHRKNDFVFLRH